MNKTGPRVGVVGAGYWGPNLIRECAQFGILDSVCDIDKAALNVIKEKYPEVETVSDFEELLKRRIDAVVIAAPAQFHASMALQSIAAGKHVFVEKPLALGVEQGEQLAEAAEACGANIFVGHILIYHPGVKKLRSLICEDAIGRVWHLRSRRLSLGKLRKHESVWWSFAPHDVAVMLSIMGDDPSAVSATRGQRNGCLIADAAYADYLFSGGRTAHLEVCWLDPEKSARLDVFGDRGVLTLTDSRAGSILTLKPFRVEQNEQGSLSIERQPEQRISYVDEDPLHLEMQAFIEMLNTGTPAETSARHGIAVLKALSMADADAQNEVQLLA